MLTSDDLVFNSTSVINAIATGSLDVNSVTIAVTFTGQFTLTGYTLKLEGNAGFSDSGITGTHNYGNGLTFNGASAACTVAATGSVITATSCILTFNGTTACTLTDNRGVSFNSLTLGTNAILTANGSGSTVLQSSTTVLTINTGATFTNNQTLNLSPQLSQTMLSFGTGYTFKGSGQFNYVGGGSLTIAIPAMTYTGTGTFNMQMSANCILNLSGNVSMGGFFTINQFNAGVTFNTNNNNITCTRLTCGSSSITNSAAIYNWGSSTVSTSNFVATDAVYTTGGTTFNMQTSIWTCTSDWGFGAHWTVTAGTSVVNFTTNSATITSNGKSFYSVVFNGSGKTYTLADPMFTNTYTLTAGTVTTSGFYIFVLSSATTNIWNRLSTAGNWNTAGDWSLGHVPTSGEDVVFNGDNSVQNCTWDVSPSIVNIGFMSNYSGVVTMTGQTTTCSGGFADYGTGNRNYGNGITINGDSSSLSIASTVGNVTATACNLIFNGTTGCFLIVNKTITCKKLTMGASANLTESGASGLTLASGTSPLVFLNGGTLTINGIISLTLNANADFYSISGSPTINGSGQLTLGITTNTGVTASIPAITLAGLSKFSISTSFANITAIYNVTGNLSLGSTNFFIRNDGVNTISTVNFNNLNITCGTFQHGNAGGTGTNTINFGSGFHTVSSLIKLTSTLAGTTNLNYQTSTWTCSGNWELGNTENVDPGTSLVTFSGGNCTVTSSGKLFYDITVNKTSAANYMAIADNLSAHNITFIQGQASWASYAVTSSGNITFNGTSSQSLGSGIILNGASSSLTFNSSLGAISSSSCILTFNGTVGCALTDNKGATFSRLVLGSNAVLTHNGSSVATLFSASTGVTLTMGNNSVFTANQTVNLFAVSGGTVSFWSIGSGCTVNGSGAWLASCEYANTVASIGAITYTGSGKLTMYGRGAYSNGTPVTFNFTGNVDWGTSEIDMTGGSNFAVVRTFNFQSYGLTCGTFILGNTGALATTFYNLGSGIFSVASFNNSGVYSAGTCTINFQTSQWTCSGNWAFGSNHIIDSGTSLVTFNTTAVSSVTSAGKSFYDIVVNNASKAFSFSDAPSLHNLTTTAMLSYTHLGFNLTSSGNVTFNGSGTLNLGNGITMNGASGILSVGSTLGVVTTNTTTALYFNGTTGMGFVVNKTINNAQWYLTLGANTVLVCSGSSNLYFVCSTVPLTMGNGSSITFNNATLVTIVPNGSMAMYSIGSGCTINGSSNIYFIGGIYTYIIPALTYTGTGSIFIDNGTGSNASPTFSQTGAINTAYPLSIYAEQYGTGSMIYNTNGNNITCSSFLTGSRSATNTIAFNCGASVIVCSSFTSATFITGVATLNFQTSQWTCSGNWTFGSNHTNSHQWDLVTFTNTASITTAGKYFNNLVINASGKTITMVDNLTCRGYQNIAGTLNKNGKQLAITGDTVVVTDNPSH